ncbi:filamentous hemagglutinin N-terminal domain-containing protein [Pseudomonas fluorescens]|uniref:hemagglutinin repeat-containing protein n=1 Tax=Pseudomonas fluorescens TaxID=294 RepID=UPI001130BCD1|nr:hemagglutinin repeat-containing protein [Pseudomonas fluorescens]TMU81542.1 filamentous hemagglutinin N-terminal domain-containing protein [Pseudomonas fluorescens]
MPAHTFAFHLSPRGKLRWAIASLFFAVHLPSALAGGVVVAPGPGGTAQLQTQGGVPIVNIVAPNGSGLSHNQFLDYNVDRQGLVLNNALQAGQSQLAGQLAANPQLQGQAASVILNEVISRNPSAINGAQEIFGRPADYVLANPNGISVNGGSFINTPNANLVVGRPELNDGKLQSLNSRDASGQLQIHSGGLRNGEGSINLIAPRIDSQGAITARDQLNLTVGRNQVDYASGQVKTVDPAGTTADQRIDASLFGAMQAGRINIVSTAEGAGVRVGAVQVAGRDGVQIRSAGDLSVSGEAVANSLDVTRAGIRSSQGDVALHSGKDLTLAATDVGGRDVTLDAKRNLTLSTVESRKLQEKRENWNNSTIGITWETYDRTQTDSESRQHGSQIIASRDARLSSGKDNELKAAKVEAAKNLSVQSAGDLRLTAATESHTRTDQGNHRKHLWKADWNSSSEEQRSVTSQLKAGNIALQTAALLRSEGAELTSAGDVQLAGKQVEITTATRTNRSSDNRYSGDLVGGGFFGKTGDADKGKTQHQGSKINASGKLIVKADDVRISGSQVRGGSDASVISDKGSLTIDGVQDTSYSNNHDKDSKFFGITKDESRQHGKDSSTVRSELVSDSNLKLKSAKDIAVAGSTVKADGALTADAAGDVNVHSTQNTHDSTDTTQTRGFDAYAKEQTPEQYRAGIHYEDKQQTVTRNDATQQGSSLSGGSVQVKAGGDVTLKGAEVKSTAGDTTLSGKNVSLLAEADSHKTSTDTSSTGGGFYYTGGLDRAGSGVDFAHSTAQDSTSKTIAQTTSVQSSGGLTINADKLATEGAQLKAGNGLNVAANEIDNRAASDSESSTHNDSNWSADIGANVEYKDIARPIAGAVKDVLNGKVPDKDALANLGQPNVGIDVAVGHGSASKTEQSSNAVVSRFDGGTVDVKTTGTLHDQGTQYNASVGQVNISADKLLADAASNMHSSNANAVDAKVDVRVYTKTGEDVNVAGSGAGGSSASSKDGSSAVVGGYAGSQGVNIKVGGDAQFEGSRFDGRQGGVSINTGGDLALNQANDRQNSNDSSLRGNGSLTVGTLPGTDGTNVDLGAGFQLDHTGKQSTDTQAHVASISGNGPVQLSSGGNQVQQGTKIDSAGAINLHAGGKLGLQAATDTHTATGSNLGGGLKGGGSKTSSEKSRDQGGNLSGNFNIGRVNEDSQTLTGGQLNSQSGVALSGDSIHLQGTQVSAPNVSIDAQKGGYVQESAQSSDHRNNWNVALNAGGNLSSKTPTAADEKASSDHGFNAGAKVGVDYLQGSTQQNSQIKADHVVLNSAGDAQLAGARIDAKDVSGKVAGDLSVESRQDASNHAKVDVDLGLTAKKNPPSDKEKLAGTDYKPTLKAQGEYAHKDSVAQASGISASQGLNLAVGGATQLTGAQISATQGKVDLGGSKVSSTDLSNRDYGVKATLDLPHKAEENAPKVSLENGNLKVGPVTLSGHLDTQTLQAGIDEKG